jgi:hypothetical protein
VFSGRPKNVFVFCSVTDKSDDSHLLFGEVILLRYV